MLVRRDQQTERQPVRVQIKHSLGVAAVRVARISEYDEIQRFLERSYGLPTNFFPQTYPCFWRRENTDFSRTYVIDEDGRIASLVRVFPLELFIGGTQITVGGIGGVATTPEHRGQGHMNVLMDHTIAQMRHEGIPLSVLWGDRHRYQAFGYETAGRRLSLTVTRRGLEKCQIPSLLPVRYYGQPELLKSIRLAYERHAHRRIRTEEEYRAVYQHSDLLLHTAGEHEKFGYLALTRDGGNHSVAEFGGEPGTILGIAKYLMDNSRVGTIIFPFPSAEAIPRVIHQAASEYRVESMGMIKILDLERTMRLILPVRPALPTNVAALGGMSQIEQVEALFGTTNSNALLNLFIWPLDCV